MGNKFKNDKFITNQIFDMFQVFKNKFKNATQRSFNSFVGLNEVKIDKLWEKCKNIFKEKVHLLWMMSWLKTYMSLMFFM